MFYSLLTGLMVYKDYSSSERHQRIVDGLTEPIGPYLESSNSAEATLAEVIEWCWVHDVDDRPEIFEVVEFLEHAVENIRKIESHHGIVSKQKRSLRS